MDFDSSPPTESEAWNYLVEHGNELVYSLPRQLRNNINGVLERKWNMKEGHGLNAHDFGLIWSDLRFRNLATKLANGPSAEVFDIETLDKLRLYRLDGYWDFLLENGADWAKMVFKEYQSRVSLKDFCVILNCYLSAGGDADTYKSNLNLYYLFWVGGEAHKASNRKDGFLTHLPLTEYSEAYNTIARNPPDPRWNFGQVMEEIREYGATSKMVMLHVASWYNPGLKEPAPRTPIKNPIYYHLKEPFRKILPSGTGKGANKGWKSTALALQEVVIDFIKDNKQFKSSFMLSTLRFSHKTAKAMQYHERFVEFPPWDLLAQEIRSKFPNIDFRHPDLLPYNTPGDNIYHAAKHKTQGSAPRGQLPRNALPIRDLAAGEEGEFSAEILDLISEEYGSDTSSIGHYYGIESRSRSLTGSKRSSQEPTPTRSFVSEEDGQQTLDDDDETVDLLSEDGETHFDSSHLRSVQTHRNSTILGKRKAADANLDSYDERDRPRKRKSKIVILKIPRLKSIINANPNLGSSSVPRTSKSGKRDVDFFREQVRQVHSPSSDIHKPSPSTSATSNEPISNPTLWKKSPIDPIPPPRRRKMLTNLPPDIYDTPRAIPSPSQERNEMSVSGSHNRPSSDPIIGTQTTLITETPNTPQAEAHLSKVEQAVKLVLDEFSDKLTVKEQVAAINVVRNENEASVFLMIKPSKLRKAWLYNEIGK